VSVGCGVLIVLACCRCVRFACEALRGVALFDEIFPERDSAAGKVILITRKKGEMSVHNSPQKRVPSNAYSRVWSMTTIQMPAESSPKSLVSCSSRSLRGEGSTQETVDATALIFDDQRK
jgi:hypothetical protein